MKGLSRVLGCHPEPGICALFSLFMAATQLTSFCHNVPSNGHLTLQIPEQFPSGWAIDSHATPSRNIEWLWSFSFSFLFLKKEHYFHNKINIKGQKAKLDEFQRLSITLQRDSKLTLQSGTQPSGLPWGTCSLCSGLATLYSVVILGAFRFESNSQIFLLM